MRLTDPLAQVLRAFLEDPTANRYGYELMKAAKLPSGTLYPMLARLEGDGLLVSEWASVQPDAGGRPPRRYYRLTGEGLRAARIELAQASMDAPRSTGATGRPASLEVER